MEKGIFLCMPPNVYVESSVISYHTARLNRDILILARQQITEQWWTHALKTYTLYVSGVVLEEISAGDPVASKKRTELVSGLKILNASPKTEKLSEFYLKYLGLPMKAIRDAAHLAIAVDCPFQQL